MSANGISHLQYKAERQTAKLALAAADRAASGRRSTLDISELPTVYAPGDNDTSHRIDNPNPGGLIVGRPWKSVSGAFTLDWYGSVSSPTATIGTYSTSNGGITLDSDSYIDVGSALSSTTFTITIDADLGLGWNGNRWHVIWGNDAYNSNPSGVFAYMNNSTTIVFGAPNHEAEGSVSDITTSGRVLYAFVSDGSTQTVYANGVSIASVNYSPTIPSNNFFIGSRHDNTGGNGPIDSRGATYYSVKVESIAKTAGQVLADYNAWNP